MVDDIAFVHNLVGKTGVHSQGTLLQTTGFVFPGFPSAGSWVSYALGSENDNLPSFVVLPDHRGFASNGAKNWANAFLPARHQGTVIRPGSETPVADLFAPKSPFIRPENDRAGLDALSRLNSLHAAARPGDDRLEARVRSYELAAAMQLSATDALDVSREPEHIRKLYGLAPEGPGVVDDDDQHEGGDGVLRSEMPRRATSARARGALRAGLERQRQRIPAAELGQSRGREARPRTARGRHGARGRRAHQGPEAARHARGHDHPLDDRIRPHALLAGSLGRDHNPFVFTNWLCGGGIRGGTFGESDEWGFRPADRAHASSVYDIHATILHQLGIDHTKLTVRNNGIDRRLTDVHGHVLREMVG